MVDWESELADLMASENNRTVIHGDTQHSQRGELTVLQPVWQVSERVQVFSTTRVGGVSQAPYDSMNVGLHVDDDGDAVNRNRALLHDELKFPSTPVWLNQVHSATVKFIDSFEQGHDDKTADGSFSRETGRVLCVLTADCLPVVISNSEGTAIAVVHAGWRGLAAGVLQSALAHFPEDDALHAWLGPAIGANSFEVGQDVYDAFSERSADNDSAFKAADNGKYFADLYALAKLELNRQRRVAVTGGDHCTYSEDALFHSFRRDGKASGRMGTFAWIA